MSKYLLFTLIFLTISCTDNRPEAVYGKALIQLEIITETKRDTINLVKDCYYNTLITEQNGEFYLLKVMDQGFMREVVTFSDPIRILNVTRL